MIMMGLGGFRFAIDALVLRKFERRAPARHADIDLVGRPPASQFLGPGSETISLPSVIYPHFLCGTGLLQVDGLRDAAASGAPLMLVAGTGRVLGNYTIRSVDDDREFFLPNGSPQKVELTIALARYVPPGGAGGGLGFAGNIFGLFA